MNNLIFGKKLFAGWLVKQGSKNKSWKKRWFVVYDNNEIRYYETNRKTSAKGSIMLSELQIMNILEDKLSHKQYKKRNVFELLCAERKWVLVAHSHEDRVLRFLSPLSLSLSLSLCMYVNLLQQTEAQMTYCAPFNKSELISPETLQHTHSHTLTLTLSLSLPLSLLSFAFLFCCCCCYERNCGSTAS